MEYFLIKIIYNYLIMNKNKKQEYRESKIILTIDL